MDDTTAARVTAARHRVRRTTRRAKQAVANRVVGLSTYPAGQALSRRVSTLDGLLKNDSSNGTINGERWLLERLAPLRPATVLDVGANEGDWTALARAALPSAVVHALEPLPATFDALRARFGDDDHVRLHCAAMSSEVGTRDLWIGSHSTVNSLTAPTDGGADARRVPVAVTSGEHLCAEERIATVDLLKIDVEGHEMEVLEGFRSLIEADRVGLVQFEFTIWAIVTRRWLRDYVDWFAAQGMVVGKLYPRRVDWSPYSIEQEQFLRCNFVAVRPGTPAAAALGCPEPSGPGGVS